MKKLTQPRAIQDVFVSLTRTDLDKCGITSLTSGFSAVNGCRQNESKQLIKNITIINKNNPQNSDPSINMS